MTIEQQEINLNKRIALFEQRLNIQIKQLCNAKIIGNNLQEYIYCGKYGRQELYKLLSSVAPNPAIYSPIVMNNFDLLYLNPEIENGNYYLLDFHIIPSNQIENGKLLVSHFNWYIEGVRKRVC